MRFIGGLPYREPAFFPPSGGRAFARLKES